MTFYFLTFVSKMSSFTSFYSGCDVNYSVGSPWSTGFNNDSDADCFAGFMGQDFRQNNMWNNSEASKSFTNASVMSRAVASPVYDRGFQHSSGHSGNLQSPSNLGAQTHFGADRFDLPSATSSCFYDNFQSGSSSISTSMRNPIVNGPSKHQQVHRNSNLPIFTDPFLTRPTSLNWSSKCEERVGAAVESASQIMVPQQVCISSMSSGYAKTAIGQVTANDTRPAAAANKPAKRLKPFSVNRKSESSKAGTLKEGANTNDPQRLKTINDGFGSRISEDVKHLTKALDTEPISAHKGHGFSVFSDNMATNLPFSGASNSGAALCTTSSDSSSFSTPASTEYIINSSPFDNLLSKSYEKASEGSNNQSDPPAPELVTMLSVGSTGSVKSESEHVASPVSIADLIPTPGVSIVENPISVARTQTRRICHSKSYLANTELNKEAERKRSVGVVFPITSDWKIEEESKPANVVAESTKPIESGTISRKESTGNNSTASSASWIFSMSEKSSGNTAETGSPVNALSVADLESFEAEAFGKVVGDKSPEAAKVAVEQVEPEKDDKEGETPEPKEKLRATKRYDREQIMSIGMNERTKVEPKVADENKDWFSLVFIGNNAEEKRTNTAYEICSRPFNSAVFNAKKVCLHPAFQKALLQSVSDK